MEWTEQERRVISAEDIVDSTNRLLTRTMHMSEGVDLRAMHLSEIEFAIHLLRQAKAVLALRMGE